MDQIDPQSSPLHPYRSIYRAEIGPHRISSRAVNPVSPQGHSWVVCQSSGRARAPASNMSNICASNFRRRPDPSRFGQNARRRRPPASLALARIRVTRALASAVGCVPAPQGQSGTRDAFFEAGAELSARCVDRESVLDARVNPGPIPYCCTRYAAWFPALVPACGSPFDSVVHAALQAQGRTEQTVAAMA
jgi:hypothetical protein